MNSPAAGLLPNGALLKVEGLNAWYFDRDAKPAVVKLDVFSGEKVNLGQVPLASAAVLVF